MVERVIAREFLLVHPNPPIVANYRSRDVHPDRWQAARTRRIHNSVSELRQARSPASSPVTLFSTMLGTRPNVRGSTAEIWADLRTQAGRSATLCRSATRARATAPAPAMQRTLTSL